MKARNRVINSLSLCYRCNTEPRCFNVACSVKHLASTGCDSVTLIRKVKKDSKKKSNLTPGLGLGEAPAVDPLGQSLSGSALLGPVTPIGPD
jgi:hypothetical protein